jgi:hypothetical protein
MDDLTQVTSSGGTYVLGLLAGGAVLGGILGALVHPGPQYVEPVGNQVARSAAFGVLATAAMMGTLYVGVRMGAIPTA